jgi:hypothetical protein
MTTRETAEQVALQGLLLLVVEVQNQVRQITEDSTREDLFTVLANIDAVVDSQQSTELVQLARAALDVRATPAAIPAAVAGVHV